jgi:hypothetical protein
MDKMYDIPKKKSKDLDPKFGVNIDKKLKPKPKPKATTLKGKAAVDAYQKSITPEALAKANIEAKKALEKKYPGMFIPETRTTSGVKRGR